jgi:hypothetical protein
MDFMANPNRRPTSFLIGERFKVDLYPASTVLPTFFVVGGYTDDQSGGWLLSEMEENLRICINEKTHKVSSVRSKYPEWWLVLVDHITYGLSSNDQDMFREQISIVHGWDKVIVVSASNHTHAFEIQSAT